MSLFSEFMSEYGFTLLSTVLTAVAGFLGMALKRLYTKLVNEKIKAQVIKTAVQAVEQIYRDLSGPEKLSEALKGASVMLADRGITVGELELRMLIESALLEYKAALAK